MDHHGLVLWMPPIEEGILGVIFQVSWPKHVVVKLLKLDSYLDHMLIVVLGRFPITLLDCVEFAHQGTVCGSSTIHRVQDFHDAAERAVPIVHRCFGSVMRASL